MRASTAIGIGAGIVLLAVGATLEGTSVLSFLNVPAALIVFGGTFGATLASMSWPQLKAVPALYMRAFRGETPDLARRLGSLTAMAERARREGLLALDDQVAEQDDQFSRKGLQLVVDGTDPDVVREILEGDIDAMGARHHQGSEPFEKAAGFAPTMGILGTVMGLVAVLKNLASPETLGPAISTAFIATLYGVGVANLVFLPVSARLKQLSRKEIDLHSMTLEGLLGIQAGDNPRVVTDRLTSFTPSEQRERDAGNEERLPDELENLVEVPEQVAA